MKRFSIHACPSTEQLARTLEPLVAADEQLTQHLDACENCRQALDSIAGDASWWTTARETLTVAQPASTTRIIESVCALSVHGSDRVLDDNLQKHEVDQLRALLEPACHPELLGRIGRYELEQLVGRGGMGLVFRGHDTELHRIVAVKTLAIHLIPIGAARERFLREARASASLIHPNIVPVHDVITEGPVPALVMQYVAGPTLEQWLAQRGPMSWQQTLQLGIQLTDALNLAHQEGLVHRDIKPGNVLLEADASRALLTDFGLVRTLDDATLTRSGMLAGTPDYMSPEQARGDVVQPSSDLFSLGSMFYAMLTGYPPFRAPDPMAVMNRICHEKHRPVCLVQPEIPVEVGKLVDKLLSKEPRRRHASAAELTVRLQQLARAKRHLTTENMRLRKMLVVSACMLLFSSGLLMFGAAIANRAQTRPVEGVAAQSLQTQAPTSSYELTMPQGILDIPELDQQLDQTQAQVERMLDAYAAPPVEEILSEVPPFEDMQLELQRIHASLKQIESEVYPQP